MFAGLFAVVRHSYVAVAYDYLPTTYFSILERAGGGGGGGGGRGGGGGGGGGTSSSARRARGSGGSMPLWLMILLGTIFGGLIFFVIFMFVRSRKKAKADFAGSAGEKSKFAGQPPPGPQELAILVGTIREHDGAFDESRFLKLADETFFKVQESWTERQASSARPLMTDACFADHEKRINEFLAKNEKNVLEGLEVSSTAIMFIESDKQTDTITVRFNAQCADYTVNVESGEVVSGNMAVGAWVEDWVFMRIRPDYLAGGGPAPSGGLEADWRLARMDEVMG